MSSGVLMMSIEDLKPSPTNPRRHFDPGRLAELAASIKAHGVLEPIVVRAKGKSHEIIAGERRYRASKLAELSEVPVRVMEFTDEQVLELQLIENEQRDDLAPLEKAKGYARLMESNPTKHTAEAIGVRLGKTARYVWDHVRLLQLIPEAQKLLERGVINAGHGFILARQTPANQKTLLDPDGDSFRRDVGLFQDEEATPPAREKGVKPDPYSGVKPVSVRELQHIVDNYIRLDATQAAAADPFLFDDLKVQVDQAAARPGRGRKVVHITHDYMANDAVRHDGTNERVYGCNSWKRADGKGGKTCEKSSLGVVVVGEVKRDERAFEVCVNRDCPVHFGGRKKKAKASSGGGSEAAAEKREADSWAQQQEERRRQQAIWDKAWPEILKSVAEAVKTASVKHVVSHARKIPDKGSMDEAGRAMAMRLDGEGMLRLMVLADLVSEGDAYDPWRSFVKAAGPFGGGVGAILKAAREAAAPKTDKKADAKKGK